jgi:hypothetical protein
MKLGALAYALDAKIVPIVVFRNDADWRASWEHQLNAIPSLQTIMCDPSFKVIDDWYFDRTDILNFWSGVGEVRVVDYDEAMKRQGDIVGPLLEILGVSCPPDTGYRLNQRASPDGGTGHQADD